MIRKFIAIDNVGRFHQYRSVGDVEFRQVNLIFAENGSGKTTLASILRSLQEQTSIYIDERVTTGAKSEPKVDVLVEGGNVKFHQGQWERAGPPCIIFDSHFVNSHVYAGNYMDGNHRKELYRFVLGEAQVNLAKELDDLDAELRSIRKRISDQIQDVESHSDGLSADKFLALGKIDDIDAELEVVAQKLATQKEAKKLHSQPNLVEINVPEFESPPLVRLLSQSLDTIASDTEAVVNAHIAAHLDRHGESWLRDGSQYLQDGQPCPFCGQDLSGSTLVRAYKTYFSEQHKELLESIRRYESKVQTALSEHSLGAIEQDVLKNEQRIVFWKQYIELASLGSPSTDIRAAWEGLRREVFEAIRKKRQDPLTAQSMDDDLRNAITQYQTSLDVVTRYNLQVQTANAAIEQQKKELAAGSVDALAQEARDLKRGKNRYRSEVNAMCQELVELENRKSTLKQTQKRKRGELDDSEVELLSTYQHQLNKYLADFGTDFTIEEYRRVNSGGKPRSAFQLRVNDETVDIGNADTEGTPCFRTLLSDGDKSTLAFAFFMAKLDTDPDLSDKIVIIDDPITSLDWYRRSRTRSIVARLRKKVRQLIILSHDDLFLREIYEHNSIPSESTRLLHLRKVDKTSQVEEWDLDEDCGNVYLQNCRTVHQFIENSEGDLTDVVKCLRPMLEENLRTRFPGVLKRNKWIGDFLKAIHDAQPNDPLYSMQGDTYETISDINDYTKPYHHGDGTGGKKLNTAELKGFARQTLKMMHGLPSK